MKGLYINDCLSTFSLEAALPLLSEQRHEVCMRFTHRQGRLTCAAAYLLLCEALQKEFGISEKPIFEYGEHGKPRLQGFPDIHFNLSHCRQAVACMVATRPVGVDVESIGRYSESLAAYTMNVDEQQRIVASGRPDIEFTRLWTMKEAVLKLSGEGIGGRSLKDVLTGREHIETSVHLSAGYVCSVAWTDEDPMKTIL